MLFLLLIALVHVDTLFGLEIVEPVDAAYQTSEISITNPKYRYLAESGENGANGEADDDKEGTALAKSGSSSTAVAVRTKRQFGGYGGYGGGFGGGFGGFGGGFGGMGCCGIMPPICCGGGIMPIPQFIPPPVCCMPVIPPPIVSCCGCCMPICVPICMRGGCGGGCGGGFGGFGGGFGFGRKKRELILTRHKDTLRHFLN